MKNGLFSRFVSLVFVFSVVFSLLFIFSSASGSDSLQGNGVYTESLFFDDFFENYVGGMALTDAEREYIRYKDGLVATYSTNIPTSQINVEYDNGTLTVIAQEYVDPYSKNGAVTWIPTSATVEGMTRNFSDSPYTVRFDGLNASAGDSVSVKYIAEISISKEKINELVNLAYKDAVRLDEELRNKTEEYERLHSEYLANKSAYDQYLLEREAYELYLVEKSIYEDKNKEYLEYLEDLSEYEEAKAKYDAYLIAREQYYEDFSAYVNYLNDLKQYNEKVQAHKQYENDIALVRNQLGIVDATKTPLTSLERTVYWAIMGDTVTAVIEKKGDIVEVLGADPVVVDMAGASTDNLRELLKDYFDIPSDNEQERYRYYVTNYEAFRDNFVNLLVALDSLYCNDGVRGVMIAKEKHEKYLILVAQLYHVANALCDEVIPSYDGTYFFDSSYKIGMKYSSDKRVSVSKALENESFIVDTNNAAPLSDGYPIEPIIPTLTPIKEPTPPTQVSKPVEPDRIEKPTEPQLVSEPTAVAHPGSQPTPYVLGSYEQSLVDAFNRGEIQERNVYTGEDVTVALDINVSKLYVGVDQVVVTYYDKEYDSEEAQKTLYIVVVDKNSYADYGGPVPEKARDYEYSYRHCGWTDENGDVPNLFSVSENLNLYPKFESVKNIYEEKWIVDGQTYFENPGTPSMNKSGEFYYDFSGWRTEADCDSLIITHTALFERPLVITEHGPCKIIYENSSFIIQPTADAYEFDIGYLLERGAGSGGIVIKNPCGLQLSLSYTDTLLVKEAGVCSIAVKASGESSSFIYGVSLLGKDGEAVSVNAKIGYRISAVIKDVSHFSFYNINNGERKNVRYGYEEGIFSFSAVPFVDYYATVEYSLNAIPFDKVEVSFQDANVQPGETVVLNLSSVPGITVDRVYYITSSGTNDRLSTTVSPG